MAVRERAARTLGMGEPRGRDPSCDRRPDESGRAYEAFIAYRNLGPARSLAKASHALRKSLSLLKRWSARHQWRMRAEVWDEGERVRAEEEARTARERAYRRRVEYAEQLEKVAMAGLRSLLVQDPGTGEVQFVNGLKASEIADLIQVACRLLPTSAVEEAPGDDGRDAGQGLSHLSQADLESLLSVLARERPQEAEGGDGD